MSFLKKAATFSFLLFLLDGCGVKGDPLPPERPAELGRGRPTYRRATEDLPIRSKVRSEKVKAGEDDDSQ